MSADDSLAFALADSLGCTHEGAWSEEREKIIRCTLTEGRRMSHRVG